MIQASARASLPLRNLEPPEPPEPPGATWAPRGSQGLPQSVPISVRSESRRNTSTFNAAQQQQGPSPVPVLKLSSPSLSHRAQKVEAASQSSLPSQEHRR